MLKYLFLILNSWITIARNGDKRLLDNNNDDIVELLKFPVTSIIFSQNYGENN